MNKFGNLSKSRMWLMASLLAAFVAGCGGGGGGGGGSPVADAGAGAAPASIGAVCTGTADCVPLGTAANYAILAKTGVSTVPGSTVTGNVGLSPAARVFLTGWSETSDVTDTFSTSAQVVAPGKLYAADYVGGTTSVDLTTAVGNMETAYTTAAGRPAGVGPNLNLGGGTLTSQSLAPGTYTWGSNVNIPTDLTFAGTGSATDVWILQITGTLDMANTMRVILANGARPQNIFWQVSDTVTIGTTAHFEGVILAQTLIALNTGATINGRLLAQSAVTLDSATVTRPAP